MIDEKMKTALYVLEQRRFSVPELMIKCKLTYPQAREAISGLERIDAVKAVGNMAFEVIEELSEKIAPILHSESKETLALLSATKEQFEGLRVAYNSGKPNMSEFSMMMLRRSWHGLSDGVVEWLVKRGVIRSDRTLAMDRNDLTGVIYFLKTFIYNDK